MTRKPKWYQLATANTRVKASSRRRVDNERQKMPPYCLRLTLHLPCCIRGRSIVGLLKCGSHRQAIGFRRSAAKQRSFLVGGTSGGDPLERVPQDLITAGAFVDREIALKHRPLRAE